MFAALLALIVFLVPPPDTLDLTGRGKAHIEPIRRTVFDAAPRSPKLTGFRKDTLAQARAEATRIRTQGSRVERKGRELILRPERGAPVVLQSIFRKKSPNPSTAYLFLTSLPGTRQWLIEVKLFGALQYHLVSQRDGTVTRLAGYPTWSPTRRWFACGCSNEANLNTVTIGRLRQRGVELLWVWLQEEDGRAEVRWEDDQTLLIRREEWFNIEPAESADGTHDLRQETRYFRLRLPQATNPSSRAPVR